MRVSIACLALLGLSDAHSIIIGRAPPPYKESFPGKELFEVTKKGFKEWGPAGSLPPPKDGPKPPLLKMPGGMPELHRPKSSGHINSDWRSDSLKGPRKKPKTYVKSLSCPKRDLLCLSSSRASKAPKFSRFRVPRSCGKAAVFAMVAPLAHQLLDTLKAMDNPIGRAVAWLDDGIAKLQVAIGGPQRKDMYGNELNYKIIQAFKRLFQACETTYDANQRLLKKIQEEQQAKEAARQKAEEQERKRIDALTRLSDTCGRLGEENLGNIQLAEKLAEGCQKLGDRMETIQAMEMAQAPGEHGKNQTAWYKNCQCDLKIPPASNTKCGIHCRALKPMFY